MSFCLQFWGSRYIMHLNRTSEWNVMTIRISLELSLFIFQLVDISWASHIHPSQKLWSFEFFESFPVQFRAVDILCVWIGDPIKMLWPFEFLKSLHCSFPSISLNHWPHTYTRVKSYDRLNFRRASDYNFESLDILWARIRHPSEMFRPFEFLESFHFRESENIMGLSHIPESKVMAIWILWASIYNFERLDILCTSIGHPSEMLWPLEFLESLRCSFSSVSIYHGPHTYTRVKSYGRLNLSRPYTFNFGRLDI